MLIARLIFGLLLLGSILCFAMYIGTRDPRWRQRGVVVLRWTVLAGLAFFAVLILQRLVPAL